VESAPDEAGWFRFRGASAAPVLFRPPTAADQMDAVGRPDPVRALWQRCVRHDTVNAALRRRIETALATLAPPLSDELEGRCFECGRTVPIFFDVSQFVLTELRDAAGAIYDDVHLLASRYHWLEAAILALPRARRTRYAELARGERLAA
jgi:hypothetical protein